MSKLFLRIGSEISLKDFSFSQLIVAVKSLLDTEGVSGLVKVLILERTEGLKSCRWKLLLIKAFGDRLRI